MLSLASSILDEAKALGMEITMATSQHYQETQGSTKGKSLPPPHTTVMESLPQQGHDEEGRGSPHLLSLILIRLLTVLLMEFCPLFEGFFFWAAYGTKMKPD